MTPPHDPNMTADISSVPADFLDAGVAAGFRRWGPISSSVARLRCKTMPNEDSSL